MRIINSVKCVQLLTGSADQQGNVWGNFLRSVGLRESKWRGEKQTTESKVRKVAWGFRFGYGPSSVWHHSLIIEGRLILKH